MLCRAAFPPEKRYLAASDGEFPMNDLVSLASVLMVGMTFPLAFWVARLCLAGVIRVLERR